VAVGSGVNVFVGDAGGVTVMVYVCVFAGVAVRVKV
jgi:hypothetical protein